MLTRSQVYNTLSKAFKGALGLGLVGASPGIEKQVPPNVQETWAGSLALSPEISGPPQFHRFFYNQVLLRAKALLHLLHGRGRCFCLPFPQIHQEYCRMVTHAVFLKDLN